MREGAGADLWSVSTAILTWNNRENYFSVNKGPLEVDSTADTTIARGEMWQFLIERSLTHNTKDKLVNTSHRFIVFACLNMDNLLKLGSAQLPHD